MKRIFKNICLASALLLLAGACKEDTLLFPPVVEDTGADGIIDVVSKPSDVVVLGEYDYHFRFKWPKFSDKVNKIVAKYTDEGVVKTAEFTNLGEDGLIETSAYGEYTFELTAYGSEGQVSNPMEITATNKGFIIEEVIATPLINLLEGEVQVSFVNSNLVPITITATYPGAAGNLTKTVSSSEDVVVISFPAQDGSHDYTIELEDAQGRKVSDTYSYEFEYIVSTQLAALFNEVNLEVSNNADVHIAEVKIVYPTATGSQTKVITDITSGSIVKFPAIAGNNLTVGLEYRDVAGRVVSRSLTYSYAPSALINHNTATLRQGWTPYASNSNSLSEGPPHFMLDGDGASNLGGIWHTQWSTTDVSSHTAVQKYPFTLIFSFTKTRAASGSGLYNEDALKAPAGPYAPILVKSITLLHRAANNRTVRNAQIYGVDLEGNEIYFGQYNLQENPGQDVVIDLNQNTVALKAVKVICLDTHHATNRFASLQEIYVTGYTQ